MPGTSLLRGTLPADSATLFERVLFTDDYERRTWHSDDDVLVTTTGYPEYPVEGFSFGPIRLLLEGRLYDTVAPGEHLERLAERLVEGDVAAVSEWMGRRDGDYLVTVVDERDGTAYVLNDTFARLPTYYTTVGDTAVVSRELKLVRAVAAAAGRPLDLDRLGVAQLLLFGYPLGDRTVFEGVSTLPPGSVLRVDDGIAVDRLYTYDFEQQSERRRSVEENARELSERFLTACAARFDPDRHTVVSLSGGLDSRAVAGAYNARDLPFDAATFDTGGDGESADSRVARRVADRLDVPWRRFAATSSATRRARLLDEKQGMNYLGMAFILHFFEQLQAKYGRCDYVTGDGGDKILVDLSPARTPTSESDLVEYVVEANSRFPLETAAAIADVDERVVVDSIRERLDDYPERSFEKQYAHFLVYERGFNFLNHGEDRNRYSFWSMSPFYSRPVFEYAMRCPDDQKANSRLYRAFLERFAPEVVDVEYPNFGAPITSVEYRAKRTLYGVLSRYPAIRDRLLDRRKIDPDRNEEILTDIRAVLGEGPVDPLSKRACLDVAADPTRYRSIPLLYLLTTLALVRDQEPVATDTAVSVPSGRDE